MWTREGIIEEIRRTAKENGGKPLGQTAFRKAAQISLFEVSKYWARFSEALVEAGFTPNKPWERYPDELLIKETIKKIRKYGRYPTLGELFVEVNNGDDFPFTIFKKRSQPYVVRKILEYCKNKPRYKDIVEACSPILERVEKKEKSEDGETTQKTGEVYLFKHGSYNHYRIGRTYDILRRGKEIRIQLPQRAILIHTIKTIDPEGVETYWLNRFKSKQMNGDWFNLKSADVKEFRNWRKIA